MKRLLFLTAFVPNDSAAAEKNTKIMLKDLSVSFNVDLVYFKYDNEQFYQPESDNINVLRIYPNSIWRKIANLLTYPIVHPMFSVRFNWSLLNWLKSIVRKNKYEAIIFDHSQMFLYAKHLDSSIPKILLSHDVIAQRVGRVSNKIMKAICTFSEQYSMNVNNAHVFSFSQKDCDLIKSLYGIKANLCLDYIEEKIINAIPKEINDEYVFMGKWSRADNLDGILWFFKEIVPNIIHPMNITIIGKDFPLDKIVNPNPLIKINVLGFVDNPYPRIANCKALLSPLFTGAGIKVKVLDALGCGTPVIGTDIAFEGIDKKSSKLMIEANTANEFIKAMNDTEISIDERLKEKERFLKSFKSETIPEYLKNKLFL